MIPARLGRTLWACAFVCVSVGVAASQPVYIFHGPGSPVFSEPAGTTMREPEVPREDETVDLWIEVGYSFDYANLAVYYTTDGSIPNGGFGTGDGSTQVLTNLNGGVVFVRNQFDPGAGRNRDWWRARLPAAARHYGQTIKYKIGTWGGPNGGFNKFTNGANTSADANQFEFVNRLAWPGAGAGSGTPGAGYPAVSFWKEEAIFGNTYTAGQLDRNGTVYDFHFPTVGGVYGVGTKNEGYVDGVDTFPPGLPLGWRGQMHLNQAMAGIRVDGMTHWLSNPDGVSYSNVEQAYVADSNTIRTTQTLVAGGNSIAVEQFDFSPLGVSWPTDNGGAPQRHIYIKRLRLTNNGPSKFANVYWYVDPAINGGDSYDGMFSLRPRGAMVAYDNTYRIVTGTGTGFTPPNEYNPTTTPGYEKNKSLYLASAMKLIGLDGVTTEAAGTEFWSDTSADQGQGWQGLRVYLPAGITREVNIIMAGAMDDSAGMTGTYDYKLDNVINWFYNYGIANMQASTDAYWAQWLNGCVTVDTPEDRYDHLFRRSLLATALHVDGVNGGVIAGFHNGAYPYVWPRDAVYAAVTLARTGHLDMARNVYEWMRTTTYRDFEPWGRLGFWKQKYTTDGYVVWGAPQIDETAVFPWGVKYQYDMTADQGMLASYVEQVRDGVLIMTRDSVDSRLRFEEAVNLCYSNNVWEDSYDTFIYSNAAIVRGLSDAAGIFRVLGLGAEAHDADTLAAQVKSGLDARLDWNGENCDISQLGITYPFGVFAANDPRVNRVADRINGVAADRFGNTHPLVNFGGEHAGTINRYWGDTYWNGGPWFLTTLWYGLYYGERQDVNPGTADIDNMKYRADLCIDRLGPAGMGAEQMAYSNSYLYPGGDFVLQTAWPNAWESMSTFVDTVMKFIDFTPEAWANRMVLEPKLPGGWSEMTFNRLTLVHAPTSRTHKVTARIERVGDGVRHTFTNHTGHDLIIRTTLRVSGAGCFGGVFRNGVPVTHDYDATAGRVTVETVIDTGIDAQTILEASFIRSADFNEDGGVDGGDVEAFYAAWEAGEPTGDFNLDGGIDGSDVEAFFTSWEAGCV